MSIDEKKGQHVLASAQSLVKDENGGQDHDYNEDSSAGHLQAERVHQGEDVERTEKASTATAGRHITSKRNGLDIAKERSAHVQAKRNESAKLFDSKRLSVVPEQKRKR
jgi:hypothetical protein